MDWMFPKSMSESERALQATIRRQRERNRALTRIARMKCRAEAAAAIRKGKRWCPRKVRWVEA